MHRRLHTPWILACALMLAACKEKPAEAPAQPAAASASAPSPAAAPAPAEPAAAATPAANASSTDQWLGKWTGPEGTYLDLSGGQGKYQVTVANLDGPAKFSGTAAGDAIEFERNGVKETIRASTGAETGMKWLAEKKNCITVKAGEGYCRD